MEQARGQFLSAAYGKFDFIAGIIPKDLVQIGKPRIIKQWLILHLKIPEEEINYSTLCSWFIRYRKLKGLTERGIENRGIKMNYSCSQFANRIGAKWLYP